MTQGSLNALPYLRSVDLLILILQSVTKKGKHYPVSQNEMVIIAEKLRSRHHAYWLERIYKKQDEISELQDPFS